MKKTLLTVLEAILQFSLIIVIAINLVSIISVKIMKTEYPNVFGYSYFSVISGSMEPTIKVGDEVIVKITKDIKEKDIITFSEDGSFITHRLIEKNGNKIITKGDNNDSLDEEISLDKVIGKVIFTIPYFGKIKYVITNRNFIIIFIVCYAIYEMLLNKKK